MSEINDGCPAILGDMPTVQPNGNKLPFAPGMSLRDAAALAALPAIIAAAASGWITPTTREGEEHACHAIARSAYETADAILKAREAKP